MAIASRRGKAPAQVRPPLGLVSGIERPGIEGAERIAAEALIVFEDESEVGLEGQVRPDVNAAERVGVFLVEELTVLAMVARLQAYVVRTRLVSGPGRTDDEIWHRFTWLEDTSQAARPRKDRRALQIYNRGAELVAAFTMAVESEHHPSAPLWILR